MGKIKFNDIIALAKSGWTPDAVKEIVSMDIKDETDEKPAENKIPEKATEKKEDPIDYKKLYEEEHEKLSKLQDSNTKKEIEPEIEIDEVLQGITKKLI